MVIFLSFFVQLEVWTFSGSIAKKNTLTRKKSKFHLTNDHIVKLECVWFSFSFSYYFWCAAAAHCFDTTVCSFQVFLFRVRALFKSRKEKKNRIQLLYVSQCSTIEHVGVCSVCAWKIIFDIDGLSLLTLLHITVRDQATQCHISTQKRTRNRNSFYWYFSTFRFVPTFQPSSIEHAAFRLHFLLPNRFPCLFSSSWSSLFNAFHLHTPNMKIKPIYGTLITNDNNTYHSGVYRMAFYFW